jgi:hypothetical protein
MSNVEWIDQDVQGRRLLQLIINDEDWDTISEGISDYWIRFLQEIQEVPWKTIYVRMQPDLGFDFHIHPDDPQDHPTDFIEKPRFDLEIARFTKEYMENDEEHVDESWKTLQRALGRPDVMKLYQPLLDEGRGAMRGAEWDGEDGFMRELKPIQDATKKT